jgi:hypothetical protein
MEADLGWLLGEHVNAGGAVSRARLDEKPSERDLEGRLLMLAIGHALASSKSWLAVLPSEILARHIAANVRDHFEDELRRHGLVTPVEHHRMIAEPQPKQREPLPRRARASDGPDALVLRLRPREHVFGALWHASINVR